MNCAVILNRWIYVGVPRNSSLLLVTPPRPALQHDLLMIIFRSRNWYNRAIAARHMKSYISDSLSRHLRQLLRALPWFLHPCSRAALQLWSHSPAMTRRCALHSTCPMSRKYSIPYIWSATYDDLKLFRIDFIQIVTQYCGHFFISVTEGCSVAYRVLFNRSGKPKLAIKSWPL